MHLNPRYLLLAAPLGSVYASATTQSGPVGGGQALSAPTVPEAPVAPVVLGAMGSTEGTAGSSQQEKPAEVGYTPPQMQLAAQQYEANKDKFAAEAAKVLDRQNNFASESLELGEIDFDFGSSSEDSSSDSEDLSSSSSSTKFSTCILYLLTATMTTLL
ncbi:hypothetical protein IWW45_002263 [Coemansia sp. RSA 485]|nr:hypothetical protein IWW45_002263 [Coemansia sp. RSA 485]